MTSKTVQLKYEQHRISLSRAAIALVLLGTAATQSVDPSSYPVMWEMDVLSGNYLGDKQYAYFQMTVTDWYFTG